MFHVEVPRAVYAEPWTTSFEQRLAAFCSGSPRIAYFYEFPDASTFRYRVYNMIQALEASDLGLSAAFFSVREMERLDPVVRTADVLIICRSRYSDRLNRLITIARNRGCRVLFDVDDLVFDVNMIHLLLDTIDKPLTETNWDIWFAGIGRMGVALQLCDGVIVTNEYLADRVRSFANLPTFVIPNFLNCEQVALSRRIYAAKKHCGFARSEHIHVGYFSGTSTHNKDFGIVAGALAELMRRDRRIVLRVVGLLESKGKLAPYASRVEFHPLQDFLNLQRLVGSTEINLVPLQDNIFTNCKSELKYFEAGIVGTLTIASPTFAYRAAIDDGQNGFLANAQEWQDKLSSLVERIDDYPEMAERAFAHCEQKYSWDKQTALIERTLLGAGRMTQPAEASEERRA